MGENGDNEWISLRVHFPIFNLSGPDNTSNARLLISASMTSYSTVMEKSVRINEKTEMKFKSNDVIFLDMRSLNLTHLINMQQIVLGQI